MRKIVCLLLSCLLILLCACGGDISNVQITPYQSDSFTANEIDDAIDESLDYFKKEFSGCTMIEITYAGDDVSADYADWTERVDGNAVIVLVSSFDVDSSGGDGSLNPNSTYSNWKWIMARTDGGNWVHVDHGY